jgi:predicted amidohydrolase YtcJ
VILLNGVIRTMDPSLPTAQALAIAGEWVVGGVGTHELALAPPDRVDLGGRCVLPGLNDAHVHFPTWAPLDCRPEELPELEAVATMLGGRWVHNPPPSLS